MKSFDIVSITSWSRCLSWRAALHRGPVLSEPVPKQRHMQSTRGRLLVLLRAGFPGRPLPAWREWVCLRALQERRHLWGPSGQLLLSVSSWVHRWVSRTVLGIFSWSSSSLKEKIKDCFLSAIIIVWCVSMAHEKAQWWWQSLTKLAPTREGRGVKTTKKIFALLLMQKMPTAVAALWFIHFAAVFPDFCRHKRHSDQHTGLLKTLWILGWKDGCISV